MTDGRQEVDADLVAAILREQHPDLADLPIRPGALGWDNQMWRLGEDLAVRLPWSTPGADALLLKEYAFLPGLAAHLPLPIPVPIRLGQPTALFPRSWIVTRWLPGEPADRAHVTRRADAAQTLAAFLAALHQPAPDNGPVSRDGRGGPLAAIDQGLRRTLAEASDRGLIADPERLLAVWGDALAAPAWFGPPVWLHADLHPANVLTSDGNICGIIDFGDLCVGDPACDLAAAWLLLPDGCMNAFHSAYTPAPDDATVRRARGWALGKALTCLIIGDNGVHGRPGGKPTWGPPGKAALARLLATEG
ncbi:MAG: aminoglycoside phosphotransferase family protein [Devosia sp.]|uniref:aminoglycoside phosphotransferase family protein n=1 Tax=unclassified Devosia TaxID=196773 RepID=UPI0019D92892|nr:MULTISPECIES: aminoglycoside phosphotransferase family protein [unclassified Devosia]MBF0680117.1 aminoglycoside phosphotransferase family protein [Devosia sp.]WEJ32808.1 aminoglycoside phosphotransferase family protein [Devosia sp. SD17-2]